MEAQHIKYLRIENFKKFDSLEISDIGQYNLIIGDNNVGKTSLLESLLIEESDSRTFSNFKTALSWRKLDIDYDTNDFNFINLYIKNPKLKKLSFSFINYAGKKLDQIIEATTLAELSEADISQLPPYAKNLNDPNRKIIKSTKNNKTRILLLQQINANEDFDLTRYIPLIPFHTTTIEDLPDFYSQHFQNNRTKRKQLVSLLKTFVSDIEDIEISTTFIPNNNCLIAWRKDREDPFLLNLFGEGTIKTLRTILEIAVCSGKRLMIDEVDTGIHYSRLKYFLKLLLNTAKENNVQVFLTTHSKECVDNYVQALQETNLQNNGRIIRLSETLSGVKGFTMRYEEFKTALEAESEIR